MQMRHIWYFSQKRGIWRVFSPQNSLTRNNQVKYLGVIRDCKLNWEFHIDNKIRKASIAYWQCRRAIGKTWGLKPKVEYWIYFGNKTDVDICRNKNINDHCKETIWSSGLLAWV
jgi:hypothetical protein